MSCAIIELHMRKSQAVISQRKRPETSLVNDVPGLGKPEAEE